MNPGSNHKAAFPFPRPVKPAQSDVSGHALCFHPGSFGHRPARATKRHLTIASDTHKTLQDIHKQHEKLPEKLRKSYLNVKAQEIRFQSLQQLSSGYDPGSIVLRCGNDQITKARDHILDHLQEPLSVSGLACTTGLNKDKLERGFRDLYGTTVHSFLVEARMKNARALLRDTFMPIPKIIRSVGYKSVTTFTKLFKNKFGRTPGTFRSMERDNNILKKDLKQKQKKWFLGFFRRLDK